ncbi:hypothetical protein ACFTWF_02910 [Rhodococcus sp. NPDC056960]|uniref:hypothetical protein n=1 Tax=Rhodococcus sp. NPDC056960 TaxID=3345982 RepID=UPI0036419127
MNTTTNARTKSLTVRLVVAGSIFMLPAGLAAAPAVASIAVPAVATVAAPAPPGQDPCDPNNSWLLPPDQIQQQMDNCNNNGQSQRDRRNEQNSAPGQFQMSPPPGFGSS